MLGLFRWMIMNSQLGEKDIKPMSKRKKLILKWLGIVVFAILLFFSLFVMVIKMGLIKKF